MIKYIKPVLVLIFITISQTIFSQFGGGPIDAGSNCPTFPAEPTKTQYCGSTVLTRSNPSNGFETWYWQSSQFGQSTANPSQSITRTSGTVYYLRAYNHNTQCWGPALGVLYSINTAPSTPTTPSVTNNCGNTVLSRGNPPSGITWYWQGSAGGTSTSNSSSSITRTSGSVYYIRGRNNSTGCWGAARSVSYTINSAPSIPSTPSVTKNCGSTVLTRGNVPNGFTWYWQSSAGSTSTSNSASSITRTFGSVYYLRSRNNSTGCWGPARSISYTINALPTTPSTPTVNVNCGNTVLSRGSVPNGFTWYWQSSNSGTSTSNSSSSITRTSGSVYYLRARNNTTGCWSTARSVPYTINSIPGIPPTPTTSNSCGITTLTRSNPPSGVTFYWQSSSSGTSTANSSTSIIRTNGSVYYLRSRSSAGCWGASKAVNYSITQPTTWYLDADNDGFAISTTPACSSPGSGYTQSSLPLGDINDNNVNITNITPQNFYQDSDGDDYGDPNVSLYYSNPPPNYVTNSDDQCPTVSAPGSGNGCFFDPVTISSDQNYIYTRVPQVAMSSIDNSQISDNTEIIDQVAYMDGLGRAMQSVGIKQSPDGKDIVTHMQYDGFGRQVKQYLPYTTTGNSYGNLKTADQDLATKTYYKNHYPDDFTGVTTASVNAYSETLFENSPLNRPLKQAAPGKDWKLGSGHEIQFEYLTNTNNEVFYFDISFAANSNRPILTQNGSYTGGELSKVITRDENWVAGKDHTTEEFTDKQGRVVLKRTYDNQIAHDTYYVYDDFGNLSFVLPPKVTIDNVSPSEIDELCYRYSYDYRNRLIEKRVPGKGWESIVYNKLDQPILTQDANQKLNNQWLFTKYDAFGRVAYTGKYLSGNTSRGTMQGYADNVNNAYEEKKTIAINLGGTNVYYSNEAFPKNNMEIYTINYYDNTTFDTDNLSVPTTTSFGASIISTTKGLATGSKVRVLGTDKWITTLTGYDYKRRPVYIISKNNELGTTDIVESKLDFVGKVLETKTTHTKGSNAPIVVIEKFTYDHAARLLTQTHKVGSNPEELIASNTYDELGQLVQKEVGNSVSSTNRLQSVDYGYNVRGWLKTINDVNSIGNDLFSFRINYNDPTSGTALYNGNISQTFWKTANTDSSLKNYTYDYDALNRITAGVDNTANHNLQSIAYDKNGNILSLNRKGHINSTATSFGIMDNLVYSYDSGNKLMSVVDNGNDVYGFKDGTNTNDDFEYDANGNMILDRNKGITGISYNHLNLPTQVNFANGNIQYLYDASGIKIKKMVTEGSSLTSTEYAGNYIYENNTLEFFNTAEGYVESNNGSYDYIYQYKDHLGNVRLSYSDTDENGSVNSSEIREENNYYPFGLQHRGYNNVVNGAEHPYKYQGKEHEEELGLDSYDFGWRDYDPAAVRWRTIDPLAERRYELTPYNFVQNSPMFRIDPDGLTDFKINKETGDVEQVGDANDDPDRVLKTDKDGNVKRKGEGFLGFLVKKSERGKAKVAFGGIEKGILKDGQNFKTDDNLIAVGGEGQPTENGVESFALRLSDYVGKEIGGTYFSKDGADNTTHIGLGKYEGNQNRKTTANGSGALRSAVSSMAEFNRFSITGFFHTHPNGAGLSDSDRLVPSGQDRRTRDNALRMNPNLRFFLIVHPDAGGKFPRRVPYHTGFPASDRR